MKSYLLNLVILLFLASCLYAEGSQVRGTISTGQDKERVYLANIQLSVVCGGSLNEPRKTTTDDAGQFSFANLPAGRCTINVDDPQVEPITTTVDILSDRPVEVELHARIRELHQSVTVTDEASQVHVDTTSSDTAAPTISQQALQSAPLINERFQDALPLLPGVVRGPDGLINIKGARAGQSGTLVNSTSAADPVTGEEAISLPLEAVASVKVLSDPFSAEYGQFAGGITEVETRSGTDQWKFLLSDFFPRMRFREGGIYGLESITPRLTFAGPLVKGRLHLFQSFDYRFVRVPVTSLPANKRDQQFETFNSSTQIDWSISEKHNLTGNLDFYPEKVRYAQMNTFNPEQVTPDLHQRGYLLSLQEHSVVGQKLVETSFSVKRFDVDAYPSTGLPGTLTLFPDQNFGTWYSSEYRNSTLYQWSQVLRIGSLKAWGNHSLSIGYLVNRSSFDGTVSNQPVIVMREDRTISQTIDFGAPASQSASSNTVAMYVQDHWSPASRISLDLGVRLEHNNLADGTLQAAPRLGFVIAPTRDGKTAVRGGVGLFYDKIPLNVASFLSYPAETITQYAGDGATIVGAPITFTHVQPVSGLKLPYSLAWTLQLDRQVTRSLLTRVGYEQRLTHRDFVIDPVESPDSGSLSLENGGRQRYREFLATVRWQASERSILSVSYVHSQAHGDLNTFSQFFGNFPNPVIRGNEYGPLPYDAPKRLLFTATLAMPWKLELSPVLDVHTGFPYSKVDENLNFVGARDSQRFPAFASLDFQLVRKFQVQVFGRTRALRAGIKVFNATNHFNPRDVQDNVNAPNFGAFFNSVRTQVRAKFEFDF